MTLRRYAHYQALVPTWLLWAYAAGAVAMLVIGLVGLLNFWRFSRWCLVVALLATLMLRPFLGMTVYSSYEGFFAAVFGLSTVWLVTVSFWTPMADRFSAKSDDRPVS